MNTPTLGGLTNGPSWEGSEGRWLGHFYCSRGGCRTKVTFPVEHEPAGIRPWEPADLPEWEVRQQLAADEYNAHELPPEWVVLTWFSKSDWHRDQWERRAFCGPRCARLAAAHIEQGKQP